MNPSTSFNMDEPICLKLELYYNFIPKDSLPDDFSGTREEAIEWFKQDVTENVADHFCPRDIYDHITEVNP